MDKLNISAGTIARTIILALAIINQVLTVTGHSPLPIEDEAITQLVSAASTIGAALVAWWKNNSFTQNALKADALLAQLNGKH